jgi:hypothetical protein
VCGVPILRIAVANAPPQIGHPRSLVTVCNSRGSYEEGAAHEVCAQKTGNGDVSKTGNGDVSSLQQDASPLFFETGNGDVSSLQQDASPLFFAQIAIVTGNGDVSK